MFRGRELFGFRCPCTAAAVTGALRTPIWRAHRTTVKAGAAIERKTGALANRFNERITVTVRPDPKALAPLVPKR